MRGPSGKAAFSRSRFARFIGHGGSVSVDLEYAPHVLRRMRQRRIEPRQVEAVLANSMISYPAPQPPGRAYRAVVHRADVDGRPLKIYVQEGTDPPRVLTAAWADEEQ